MKEGYSLSGKALLYSFFIGMISELLANYIYENVIRIVQIKCLFKFIFQILNNIIK